MLYKLVNETEEEDKDDLILRAGGGHSSTRGHSNKIQKLRCMSNVKKTKNLA